MSACGPFVPLSPSGDFLPLGCSLTLWSGREAGGLLVLGSGPQWECGCWAGLPHWRKEELSVGPGNSDLASTYFLHLLTMARLLQALPLLLLTRRKLPCFLALSPRVLRGSISILALGSLCTSLITESNWPSQSTFQCTHLSFLMRWIITALLNLSVRVFYKLHSATWILNVIIILDSGCPTVIWWKKSLRLKKPLRL